LWIMMLGTKEARSSQDYNSRSDAAGYNVKIRTWPYYTAFSLLLAFGISELGLLAYIIHLITTNDAEVEAVGSTGRSLFQWTLFPTLVTVVGSFVGLVMPSYRPGSVWSFSVAILACSSLLWLIAAALFEAYLDFEASIRNFNTCGTFIEAPSCHIMQSVRAIAWIILGLCIVSLATLVLMRRSLRRA